jgi:hypothetical protein
MALTAPWSWWVNPAGGAVTYYENYTFVDVMRLGDVYYGRTPDGALHVLGGDTDAGVAIPWEFQTGLNDHGHPGQKGLMAVYLDGLIYGDVEFEVHTDTGEVRTYAHTGSPDHRPHRISIGRGIRTRNMALGMRGADGFELDALTPELRFTYRNL